MTFVRYDETTGKIVDFGYMADEFIQAEIDAGKPTLFAENVYDFDTWKVDLATKTIVPNTPLPTPQGE